MRKEQWKWMFAMGIILAQSPGPQPMQPNMPPPLATPSLPPAGTPNAPAFGAPTNATMPVTPPPATWPTITSPQTTPTTPIPKPIQPFSQLNFSRSPRLTMPPTTLP